MRNLLMIGAVVAAFGLSGCATKVPDNAVLQTSSPIFIDKKPVTRTMYVDIRNNTSVDLNLTRAIQSEFARQGYRMVPGSMAEVKIDGTINYFRRQNEDNGNPRVSFGFGFGFGSGHHHHTHSGMGIGIGFPAGRYDYRDYYACDAQVALRIRIGATPYMTNLNYQNTEEIGLSREIDAFNTRVNNYLKSLLLP